MPMVSSKAVGVSLSLFLAVLVLKTLARALLWLISMEVVILTSSYPMLIVKKKVNSGDAIALENIWVSVDLSPTVGVRPLKFQDHLARTITEPASLLPI